MRLVNVVSEYLSNKFRWLSLVATWAVVGIHSRTTTGAIGTVDFPTRMQDMFTDIFRFAVPLFFMISGYLFVSSFERHGWTPLLKRKIKSLYVPMVLWGVIGLVMFLPIRLYLKEDIPTVFDLLKLPLLVLAAGGGHFWYVRILIVMFIFAPAVYYIAKRTWAVMICVAVALLIPADSVAAHLHIPVAIIFIALGTQLAVHRCRSVVTTRRAASLFAFCLIGLILSFLLREQLTTHYLLILFEPLFMIGILWFGYDLVNGIRPIGKFPEKLNVMFFVYCMHVIVLYWSRGVLRMGIGTSPAMSMVRYVMLLLTFWMDIAIANGVRKISPRMFAVLAGGR